MQNTKVSKSELDHAKLIMNNYLISKGKEAEAIINNNKIQIVKRQDKINDKVSR